MIAASVPTRTANFGRTLLVASSGGHLKELACLRPRLSLGDGIEWATFDTPQSRSLLNGEKVHLVDAIAPRDIASLARDLAPAWGILRRGHYDRLVSTGSGIALAFIPLARALGIECHYIESAARPCDPSLTGRLVRRIPGVRTYSQSRAWRDSRWPYGGSVFDGFERAAGDEQSIKRVVVTVGTLDLPFRSLVERLLRVLPADAEVLWQVGKKEAAGLGIDATPQLPEHQLADAMRRADAVVSHAGIGSALSILECGHCPVLVPRRHHRGEHVDDHQMFIAGELAERGLAVTRDASAVRLEDLQQASAIRVRRQSLPKLFELSR